jgi:hypothetical protein
MKIKISEATPLQIDYLVTKCEGVNIGAPSHIPYTAEFCAMHDAGDLAYSTDWAQGGPIIERERLSFCYNGFNGDATPPEKAYIGFIWNGHQHEDLAFGETPLIAAMRCYVASKLGDEVEIPEELTQ